MLMAALNPSNSPPDTQALAMKDEVLQIKVLSCTQHPPKTYGKEASSFKSSDTHVPSTY